MATLPVNTWEGDDQQLLFKLNHISNSNRPDVVVNPLPAPNRISKGQSTRRSICISCIILISGENVRKTEPVGDGRDKEGEKGRVLVRSNRRLWKVP